MNLIFIGTPEFAVNSLEALITAGHNIKLVITQKDKPKGRGNHVIYSPVKQCALEHGIEIFQPEKIKDKKNIEKIKKYNIDVIVVVAYGQILSKEILDIPKYGCINVHASLLPKYRGSAPIQYALLNGDKTTGVTTIIMDEGLDTGDILLQKEINIEPLDNGQTLHDKLSILGAELIVNTLEKIDTIIPIKQDNKKASYIPLIKKETGHINFNDSAIKIERLIRALIPTPGAYSRLDGQTIKIWNAYISKKSYPGKIGEIVDINKNEILVKTGDGILAITQIQLPSKKRMEIKEFLNGNNINMGDRFT